MKKLCVVLITYCSISTVQEEPIRLGTIDNISPVVGQFLHYRDIGQFAQSCVANNAQLTRILSALKRNPVRIASKIADAFIPELHDLLNLMGKFWRRWRLEDSIIQSLQASVDDLDQNGAALQEPEYHRRPIRFIRDPSYRTLPGYNRLAARYYNRECEWHLMKLGRNNIFVLSEDETHIAAYFYAGHTRTYTFGTVASGEWIVEKNSFNLRICWLLPHVLEALEQEGLELNVNRMDFALELLLPCFRNRILLDSNAGSASAFLVDYGEAIEALGDLLE